MNGPVVTTLPIVSNHVIVSRHAVCPGPQFIALANSLLSSKQRNGHACTMPSVILSRSCDTATQISSSTRQKNTMSKRPGGV